MEEKSLTIDEHGEINVVARSDRCPNDGINMITGEKISIQRAIIDEFFLHKDNEFKRLSEYRRRGWTTNKEIADAHFAAQRKRADSADTKTQRIFYKMMVEIAEEMHSAANIFDVPQSKKEEDFKVLDICMAPGGYTSASLKFLPQAKCFGITLPTKLGGHPILVDKSKLRGIQYHDVTLLLGEFSGEKSEPEIHPEEAGFSMIRPFRHHKFDLVFCDGTVLRTHQRPEWRGVAIEVTRLLVSQLILTMQRLCDNDGTMVILLHKVDEWDTILTIRAFHQFADVQLFKPAKKHNTRSSFYMIAKNINLQSEAAQKALHSWRKAWWKMTFGGEYGLSELLEPDEDVFKVLEEFGDQLVKMARPIWKIQADALSTTKYVGNEGHFPGPLK